MEQNEIFEAVKAVVMDVLKIDGDDITLETRFIEDLKADLMDQFFLIDGFARNLTSTSPMRMPETSTPSAMQ